MNIKTNTMDKNIKTETYLNDLLAKTYDAQRGYANAAEATNQVQLKKWFVNQGIQRTQFAAQLTQEIKNMNQEPEFDGTFLGDVHRGWMNLKSALSLNTDEAILEECIRGEKAAVDEYTNVLEHKSELPPTVVTLLQNQQADIRTTVSKIKSLEDIASHEG